MAKSKGEIQAIILNDLVSINNRRVELTKRLEENVEDNLAYLRELATQLLQSSSGPFVAKTPKILRKKAIPRIETILENKVFDGETSRSTTSLQSVDMEEQEASVLGGRLKRNASRKAADNIKKLSSFTNDKIRGEFEDQNDNTPSRRAKRQTSTKRKKSASSSDEDEDIRSSSKYSKIDEDLGKLKKMTRLTKKKSEQIAQTAALLKKIQEVEGIKKGKSTVKLSTSQCSDRSISKGSQYGEVNRVDDVIIAPNTDNMEEQSMYEDAIEKPTPIMNSTMKHSIEKKLNVTVVLERLPQQTKLNETIVIQKAANRTDSKEKTSANKVPQDSSVHLKKDILEFDNYNELITEDESSPERKRPKYLDKNKEVKNLSSDNEIPSTPLKTRLRGASTVAQERINKTYKSSALFSPYTKESVKKRVAAFEQAGMLSPKIDVDTATRITRSKTRALNRNSATENSEKNVKQILARKSLAKAKRISLAKQVKDTEEFKENKDTTTMPERIAKLLDKPSTKQTQQKTTPLGKLRMVQTPMSMNRLQTPTNGQNVSNYSKILSAQRTNIITNMDSLISKNVNKTNSTSSEKAEDKKPHEEDARKKREEHLRLMTEQKRRKRQEKELKNKLARAAKEREEQEKREKAERERVEKERSALLAQEKQREELEKKRHAQTLRAQEKEQRRKKEMQQKLQKLQEQEETERLLAEQKRREQEAERRKEAEVRAQQQAVAETLKQRQLMLAAQAKSKFHQGPTNYKLESDPDDDSDDESRPKHEIPYWARPSNRNAQLQIQRHIPQETVNAFFGTRMCTPDLSELFHNIDKSRLKRTSSAIWKAPPRTDMMEVDY